MPREKNPTPSPARKRAPRKAAPQGDARGENRVENAVTLAHFVGPEQRAALIAEAAFFRAEKRGFAPGNEVEDWLAAESEVDTKLMSARAGRPD